MLRARATDFMEPKVEDRSAGALDITIDSDASGRDASARLYREVLDERAGPRLERTAHVTDRRDAGAGEAPNPWANVFGSFSKFAASSKYFQPQMDSQPAPDRAQVEHAAFQRDRRQPVVQRDDDYGLPAYTRPLPDSGRRQSGNGIPYRDRMPDRNGEGDIIDERPRVTVRDGGEIGLPPRRSSMPGSKFFRDVLGATGNPKDLGVTGVRREEEILRQIELGNVPDFMRRFKTITVTDARGNRAELKVMPDYLAIGTNEDYRRVPVTPLLAKAIADRYGLALPTKKVVDDIYQQADVRLVGQGLVYTKRDTNYMQGNGFYLLHDKKIEEQLNGRGHGQLVAGHKKDLIVSRYLESHPGGLDFYGLFKADGTATQDNPAHENTYVDYSHGARFISQEVMVNGRPMRYDEVLANPQLAGLLSYEGPVRTANIYKRPHNNRQAYAAIVASGNQGGYA